MKKNYIIAFLISISLLLIFIFFPRTVEQGVFIGKGSNTVSLYVDGKLKKYKASITYPKFTVLSFKYNLVKAYNFKVLPPIKDRVMIKNVDSFDLETQGLTYISNKASFYLIDKNNNIIPCSRNNIIVGKNNLRSFKNSNNKLQTFLVFPMDYSSMRVGISTTNFSSLYHKASEIKCTTKSKLFNLREKFSMDIPKDSQIVIEDENNQLRVIVNNKTLVFKTRVYLEGQALSLTNIIRGIPSFTPNYNGVLEFSNTSKGMCIINEVNLEDYLSKVVPSEMPLSGGIEALKCQAIAARTYAISDMVLNRYASLGFYVDDSTQSQVYNNIPVQPLSTEAVRSTKGMIMTYNSEPIDAKYYSTSCGFGVPYDTVWFRGDGSSEDKPYLTFNNYTVPEVKAPKDEKGWLDFYKNTKIQALDSIYPYYRWHVQFSKEGLTRVINKSMRLSYEKRKEFITITQNNKVVKKVPELVGLKDIKIIKRGAGGNVMELSLIFSNATVNIKADLNIRAILRCSPEFSNEQTTLVRLKGNPLTDVSSLPSTFFSVEKNADKFIIYGGGFGHGCGMSQYGAIELSKKGSNYLDIINVFYKGITLDRIY